MAHLQRSPLLPKLLLLVLILCVCMQVGSTRKIKIKTRETDIQCSRPRANTYSYRNLFASPRQLRRFACQQYPENIFRITKVKRRFPVNPNGTHCHTSYPLRRLTRDANEDQHDPCCEWRISIVVPKEVEALNGLSYTVKHYQSFNQWVYTVDCISLGLPCNNNGTCQVQYRIQPILVEAGNSEIFVLANIPNHCYCQFQ